MSELFRNVLNASFQGSIVITAVLLLRLVLKKAPKKYICLLWILAGLRLLMPFSIESKLSLQPQSEIMTEVQWQEFRDYGQLLPQDAQMELPQEAPPEVVPGLPVDQPVTVLPEQPSADEILPQIEPEVGYQLNWAMVLPALWLTGVCGMVLYSALSYLFLKQRIREAVRTEGRIWESEKIGTAFILGYFRPRIYLPTGLDGQQRQMILEHEKCHLRRLDHWTKLLGFITLAIHWFNPLVWLAYGMLCQEIEMACDEQVVEKMDLSQRKCYSAALLTFSTRGHLACPVAFGEKPVKRRIRAVLNYRKPAFWLTLCAVVAIIFVAVSLLTSPKIEEEEILRAGYTGPYDPYETYHTTEREQKWEEDILYMAEMMLDKHPRLYEGDSFIYHGIGLDDKEFSNVMYDAEIRKAFIDGIDTLIPKLDQWSDDRIPFEINRVLATVGDINMHIFTVTGEYLDFSVEPIWDGGEVTYYLVDVPTEHADLMFGELTAINGIPSEEIVEQLKTCVASGYDRWAIGLCSGIDYNSYMVLRGGLEAAEAIEPGAKSVEITVKTDAGEQTVTMPIVTVEEMKAEKNYNKSLYFTDLPPYRYLMNGPDRKDVWCVTLEDAVYLQINRIPYENTEFDQGLLQTVNALRDAAEPMKLIIDLRWLGNGTDPSGQLASFAAKVNALNTDGIYILIDYLTQYHGPAAAYQLRQQIEGALLVGSSTGDSLNRFISSNEYRMPNSGLVFGVQERYACMDESFGNRTVQPDITVYQTLEDYKNGIDTVYQYALDAGKETTQLSRQQREEISNQFFDELRRIQDSEEIAFDISTTLESDYEFFRGHEQTWWISGEDWYRVFHYDTNMGQYSEEYLQTGGKQFAKREAAHIVKLGDLEWTQLPDGQVELPPLLTRDWTHWYILDIREEQSSDGGVMTVVVQGDMESTPEKTYYEHTHEFHLDKNGRLVGVVEYSFTDQYINQLGTEGRFYMKGRSHVIFKETKVGVVKERIEKAAEEVRAVLTVE